MQSDIDLDMDFIRYSLADEAIDSFIRKLNCLDEITIHRIGSIEELKQQDYHGKRVYVEISDRAGNKITSKFHAPSAFFIRSPSGFERFGLRFDGQVQKLS